MSPENIKALIESHIENCTTHIDSEDNQHFQAIVISPAFGSLSSVKRQQLVYQAITQFITNGHLHAISLKTFTPQEWEAQSCDN